MNFKKYILLFVLLLSGLVYKSEAGSLCFPIDRSRELWTKKEDTLGVTEVISGNSIIEDFKCLPNPSGEKVEVKYNLLKDSFVKLELFAEDGRLINTFIESEQIAGEYSTDIKSDEDKGSRLSSGTYYFKITAGKFTKTITVIIIK